MGAGITIIGLGPGDPGLLTREVWDLLSAASELHLRSRLHPVVPYLPQSLALSSFDSLYENLDTFELVYQAMVEQLTTLGKRPEGVNYAVPGDPTVGEATVAALREFAADEGLPFRIAHGISFIEPCLALLGLDALEGTYIADALDLATGHHPPFHPDAGVLIGQLYDRMVAADVKLTLMNQYPPDHPVALIHQAGTPEAAVEFMPLHGIDQGDSIGSLTALYVSPLPQQSAFESFQDTVAHLRAPDGCPWDKEQTHQSLRPHLLEEAYEALSALDAGDPEALREELGDLLLQIVLQAQIATEEGTFTMADVIATIQDKILRRHPHVFGGLELKDVNEVLHNWELLKAEERANHGMLAGLLDGVPLNLPALAQAAEIQARVVRVGFDWPDVSGVVAKIHEELEEVASAETPQWQAAEIGDLLFAVVNYARWLDVDPEAQLREACRRFRARFARLEAEATRQDRPLSEWSLDEMEALWESTKSEGDA